MIILCICHLSTLALLTYHKKRPAVPAAVDLIGTDQEVRRSPRLAKVHVQERMHEASPRKLFHASTESLESLCSNSSALFIIIIIDILFKLVAIITLHTFTVN